MENTEGDGGGNLLLLQRVQHEALVRQAIAEFGSLRAKYAKLLPELADLFEEVDALAEIEQFIGPEEYAS